MCQNQTNQWIINDWMINKYRKCISSHLPTVIFSFLNIPNTSHNTNTLECSAPCWFWKQATKIITTTIKTMSFSQIHLLRPDVYDVLHVRVRADLHIGSWRGDPQQQHWMETSFFCNEVTTQSRVEGCSRAVRMKKHKMWSSLIHSHPQHHINKKVWQGGWKARTVPMFPSLIQSLNAADAASMHFSAMLPGKNNNLGLAAFMKTVISNCLYLHFKAMCRPKTILMSSFLNCSNNHVRQGERLSHAD